MPIRWLWTNWPLGWAKSIYDNLAFRRTSTWTSGRHSVLLNFTCQRSSLSMKLSFVSDSQAKSCIFATAFLTLFPFLLFVLKGQTRRHEDYDSPRGSLYGQIYDFHFQELLVYLEFRLNSRSSMFFFFICHVTGLGESQSQALNSNLLRDKLKLQW